MHTFWAYFRHCVLKYMNGNVTNAQIYSESLHKHIRCFFFVNFLTSVYSTVYSGADQRKYQSSASLAFVRGIHRWPVNSPHKGPVTRKMFPFDNVIMKSGIKQWTMYVITNPRPFPLSLCIKRASGVNFTMSAKPSVLSFALFWNTFTLEYLNVKSNNFEMLMQRKCPGQTYHSNIPQIRKLDLVINDPKFICYKRLEESLGRVVMEVLFQMS